MAKKKEFDKKYDDAFDDFRTSGSMPDIPSLSEQYSAAASFARQSGIEVKGDEGFGKRITEEQQVLENMQKQSMQEYQELKEELLVDTFFISSVIFSVMNVFLADSTVNSFVIGAVSSLAYAFLLTRTADRLGESGSSSTMFDPSTPARFGLLLVLIVAYTKNKEYLEILPMLFGFFFPYKVASLRPALNSLPPLKPNEIRITRSAWEPVDAAPLKVEYGSDITGRMPSSTLRTASSDSSTKTQGSSAPLGKRKILSIEEQYEALKKGTLS